MAKFRGYSLIRLDRAVDESTGPEAYTYECTVTNAMGKTEQKFLSVAQVERDWMKLRMQGDRFAVLVGGICRAITEEEYAKMLI